MHNKIFFQSSILRLDLVPDRRGHILFSLSKQDPNDVTVFVPLTSEDELICEYLPDLVLVCYKAMEWISHNGVEIAHDRQHLYFRFRNVAEQIQAVIPKASHSLRLFGKWKLPRLFNGLFRS